MKTTFTIAGYGIHGSSVDKLTILNKGLRSKGYSVVPVDITWRYKTHTQYSKEFVDFYDKYKTEENIVIGNSFGAAVAFMSAPIIKPDKIYLCSLSPFFKEDRSIYPDDYTIGIFGKRRAEDFWSYSADELAKRVSELGIPTVVVYGQKEHETSKALVARCQETVKAIKGAELIEIPNCPHNMSDETYSKVMVEML